MNPPDSLNRVSKRLSRLSPEKRALFEVKLKQSGHSSSSPQTILPRKNRECAPLSWGQERMWFLHQYDELNRAYNRPAALRITGYLKVDVLLQCLQEIVQRHDILRASFPERHGIPEQNFRSTLPLEMPVINLQSIPAQKQEQEIKRLIQEETQRPFDMARGPLLRFSLLRKSSTDHILVFIIHHIIFDGWSMGIFLGELSTLYQAFCSGKPTPLLELSIQYPDFAQWQRDLFQTDMMKEHLAYWKQQLDGAPPFSELPCDNPGSFKQTFPGVRHTFKVPGAVRETVRDISRREGVTLFMTLFASFLTLLYRYTGQEDLIIGVPVAGRELMETEGLIGMFINTLALRVNLSGNPTFLELLHKVHEVTLAAYAHQQVPFEKIVEELKIKRTGNHPPLFQIMFTVRNIPNYGPYEGAGLKITPIDLDSGIAIYDLSMEVLDVEGSLAVSILYNTDLFDEQSIERFADHYQRLLSGIGSHPAHHISQYQMLSEKELQSLIVDWNARTAEFAQTACIHHLFEFQVQQTPDAVAVVFEGQCITYQELNRRANQVAHLLRRQGVAPETTVGIYIERSLEMIIGLLGILKAGGAYVPLDPAYPRGLTAFMLQDTNAPMIVTQSHLNRRLSRVETQIIDIDSLWQEIKPDWVENPHSGVIPDNLAYIIYTSGTTGKPKGVLISHRNVVGFLHSYGQRTGLDVPRIGTSVITFSFDTSVEEIFSILCFGGTLHIIRPENSTNPDYFARYLVERHINTSYILPTFIPDIASHLHELGLPLNFRCLLTGLESKKQKVLQTFRDLSAEILILNGYGPTEVTYGATSYTFEKAVESEREVPIGSVFPNYETYIVDERMNVIPVGLKGELLIGGVGISRGYHNRPDVTAEKFIPDLFNPEKMNRLYRTGDLTRYLPEGTICFHGRIDNQVKLRGYRIELQHIAAVLQQHPAVGKTTVIVREETSGQKYLVAYIIPDQNTVCGDTKNDPEQKYLVEKLQPLLRQHLESKVPHYMIPAAFVFLNKFPLTPTDKIDIRSLPPPDHVHPEQSGKFVAPRNHLEEVIAGIWSHILKYESIGVYNNFFDLGGHSLLATQIISRIRDYFKLDLTIQNMFEYPTIDQMTKYLLKCESKPGQLETIARLLKEVMSMTATDRKKVLNQQREQRE
ncbi:amino acid adenylation domain-containing protein [candidate division CSSED10-310 bacterium]|uniref:Amino acid adenylation domain-containing protein n=1 Tax=candidate division CSSED10-310 bacterium TaxID=2855610 RepID=A0ABV6Z0K0_UNCC1